MKIDQCLLLLVCMTSCQCSIGVKRIRENEANNTIDTVPGMRNDAIIYATPGISDVSAHAEGQLVVQTKPQQSVVSLVIECMATKYLNIGDCSKNQQKVFTTHEMQTKALEESLQSGMVSGELSSFASAVSVIRVAPEGEKFVQQFFKNVIDRALVFNSKAALFGLLLAGPDIMISDADLIGDTMLFAIANDLQLLEQCLEAVDGHESEMETILSKALLAASESSPASTIVLLRCLWNKLPILKWKLEDCLLQNILKNTECVATIIEITNGCLENYKDELSAMLVGASSGHADCLALLLSATRGHASIFEEALGTAFKNSSKGCNECLQLILPLITPNVVAFKEDIGCALRNASKGHLECLVLILPLVTPNASEFKMDIGLALRYASIGHFDCLQLILPLMTPNVADFKEDIGLALLNASEGHIECLMVILPLITPNVSMFQREVGWALQNASRGHCECLQLILPLITPNVAAFRDDIGWALLNASNNHFACLEMILPLIHSSRSVFISDIENVLKYHRNLGNTQIIRMLEYTYQRN